MNDERVLYKHDKYDQAGARNRSLVGEDSPIWVNPFLVGIILYNVKLGILVYFKII